MIPTLYIIIPCYNEEQVLPLTAPRFLAQLESMTAAGLVAADSRILFVDDGSKDKTWEIISALATQDSRYIGIAQSRNRGHQSAVLAGLMEAKDRCDITISIDCDGQDDIAAMERMVQEYRDGAEVVYGVRSNRRTDGFFKRTTAQGFYKLLSAMGAEVVYNHADYRLVSARVLQELAGFKEVNLFLRGLIPLVGFKSTSIYYERQERMAGKSHYSPRKMAGLAVDGITSLSVKPLRMISVLGFVMSLISFVCVVWAVVAKLLQHTVAGWTSTIAIVCLMCGIQLVCLGVIGEYIGKLYMEVKGRPRYIISDRTEDNTAQTAHTEDTN